MNQGLFQIIFLTKYPSCAFKRTLKQFNVCGKRQSSQNRKMYLSTGITLYKKINSNVINWRVSRGVSRPQTQRASFVMASFCKYIY